MAFYSPCKLYGNHNPRLPGEVTENNNPTVISRETEAGAVVFIYLSVCLIYESQP